MAATLGDVRPVWMCGTAWAFMARCDDVLVGAYATIGAQGLDAVWLRRRDPEPSWPARTPVAWRDIDLFGYPATDMKPAIAAELATGDLTTLASELGLAIDPWNVPPRDPGWALTLGTTRRTRPPRADSSTCPGPPGRSTRPMPRWPPSAAAGDSRRPARPRRRLPAT
jgi:hypothetical protein